MIKRFKINSYEKGLLFKENELQDVLGKGKYIHIDPLNRIRIDNVSLSNHWIEHKDLDLALRFN